jgi:hypothetical protein
MIKMKMKNEDKITATYNSTLELDIIPKASPEG